MKKSVSQQPVCIRLYNDDTEYYKQIRDTEVYEKYRYQVDALKKVIEQKGSIKCAAM